MAAQRRQSRRLFDAWLGLACHRSVVAAKSLAGHGCERPKPVTLPATAGVEKEVEAFLEAQQSEDYMNGGHAIHCNRGEK
jgi:hypothetical protein